MTDQKTLPIVTRDANLKEGGILIPVLRVNGFCAYYVKLTGVRIEGSQDISLIIRTIRRFKQKREVRSSQ